MPAANISGSNTRRETEEREKEREVITIPITAKADTGNARPYSTLDAAPLAPAAARPADRPPAK